jgi:uracil-DNA glycosylase family 4
VSVDLYGIGGIYIVKRPESNILDDIRTMLQFYQALGIEGLPLNMTPPCSMGEYNSDKGTILVALRNEIGDCIRCKLSEKRKNIVFGEGNPAARIMFIGEAPGREEDVQGRPFVGDAGLLLTKLIEKMSIGDVGLKRDDVYIANIVKCRPPMNRDPEEDEIACCRAFIERQIEIIGPEVIITLGRIALQTLLNRRELKITAVRGNFFAYKGIPVMPTFHPAYLLRNPKDKWLTWSDVQKVLELLSGKRS